LAVPVFSGLVVVMVSVVSTVSEKVAEAVLSAESVTVTTMLNVPATVGAPEIRPAVERLSPAGNDEPLAAAQVQLYPVPVPPVAASVVAG
jgi:hypothetical protein